MRKSLSTRGKRLGETIPFCLLFLLLRSVPYFIEVLISNLARKVLILTYFEGCIDVFDHTFLA